MHRTDSTETALDRWTSHAIALFVLSALAAHVLLTLVYLSPPNIAQEHLGRVAAAYMKPLFSQNWHLFSPNPGVSTRKLAIRCEDEDGRWSEWFDPTEELVARHNANRISGVGKLLYVYRAIGDDLRREMLERLVACQRRRLATPDEQETPEGELDALEHLALDELAGPIECTPEALMDELLPTEEFALAIRYAETVCESWAAEEGLELHATQIELLEFFPIKYADRPDADASGRRWDKVHEVEFPVIEVE